MAETDKLRLLPITKFTILHRQYFIIMTIFLL